MLYDYIKQHYKEAEPIFFRAGKREHHKVGIEPAICICVTNAGTIKKS